MEQLNKITYDTQNTLTNFNLLYLESRFVKCNIVSCILNNKIQGNIV